MQPGVQPSSSTQHCPFFFWASLEGEIKKPETEKRRYLMSCYYFPSVCFCQDTSSAAPLAWLLSNQALLSFHSLVSTVTRCKCQPVADRKWVLRKQRTVPGTGRVMSRGEEATARAWRHILLLSPFSDVSFIYFFHSSSLRRSEVTWSRASSPSICIYLRRGVGLFFCHVCHYAIGGGPHAPGVRLSTGGHDVHLFLSVLLSRDHFTCK